MPKIRNHLLTLAVFLLVFTTSMGLVTDSVSSGDSNTTHKLKTQKRGPVVVSGYSSHDPIIINSNVDFATQGWPGSGNSTDPYLIEGLHIANVTGIIIGNTTVHFVIRNCFIESNRTGILLNNVTNGEIRDSFFKRNHYGISGENCSHMRITNNTFYFTGWGIFLTNLDSITITDSKFELARLSIILAGGLSDPNSKAYIVDVIIKNCIFNRTTSAIQSLKKINNVTIQSSLFIDSINGITTRGGSYLDIINNTFTKTASGINIMDLPIIPLRIINNTLDRSAMWIDDSQPESGTEISGNTINGIKFGFFQNMHDTVINGNDYGQIILVNSNNVNITHGHFANVTQAISILKSSKCMVSDVTIERTDGSSIFISDSTDCTITNSRFYDLSSNAITGKDLRDIQIINNSIFHCKSGGIRLYNVTNAAIRNNTIIRTQYTGIDLTDTSSIIIEDNVIKDIEDSGAIYASVSESIVITKNEIVNNTNGLLIFNTFDSTISSCKIIKNRAIGIQLYNCQTFSVISNIVANNSLGIYLKDSSNCTLVKNIISLNSELNAKDDGSDNKWDDGKSIGNSWGDYTGGSTYAISGTANSIDYFPTVSDIDGDGLIDIDELQKYGTDPYNPDTDGDGVYDGDEVRMWRDPLDPNDQGPWGLIIIIAAAVAIVSLCILKKRR
ncbi:MAG: right-handed parallel beta-helix repeat-containing protein [Candidatus Thorarchaeota archaeon]|nr:right-handed parallel beta-helix repeat-containing protein [Candidatus Thorarchaeota archaeon]